MSESECFVEGLPEELLLQILRGLEVSDLLRISEAGRRWKFLCDDDSLWKHLYKTNFFTNAIRFFLSRTWRQAFRERYSTERHRLGKERLEVIAKREIDETEKFAKRMMHMSFQYLRHQRFVAIGDMLRDLPHASLTADERLLVYHVAHENYSSGHAQNPKNYIGLFSWGYVIHCIAKTFPKAVNVHDVYNFCFAIYEQGLAIDENLLKEDTLTRWGDAYHDYAKTFTNRKDVIRILERSYEKFQQAISKSPDNYLAHDYYGLALYSHCKLLKSDHTAMDAMYTRCYEQFSRAHTLKPRDGYVVCHWATALQMQASTKDGAEALRIYRQAFVQYSLSASLQPEDAFVLRSWGDALHDCAKKLIHVAEYPAATAHDKTDFLSEAEKMLDEAGVHFGNSVRLRKDYSNALNNWGLSLSTHAKILPEESRTDELFTLAFEKFAQALATQPEKEEAYIVCNFGMTLINHARKKAEFGRLEEYEAKMKDAYDKFVPLANDEKRPDTWSWFCLARWAAVAMKFDECRFWLLKFQEKDNFLPRATKGQMNYFKNVEQCDWFKDIIETSRRRDPDFVELS